MCAIWLKLWLQRVTFLVRLQIRPCSSPSKFLHSRFLKSPWGAQMSNHTTTGTQTSPWRQLNLQHVVQQETTGAQKQRPLWKYVDSQMWLSAPETPTDLAGPDMLAYKMQDQTTDPQVYDDWSRWSHLLFLLPKTKGSWGGLHVRRWVASNSFLLGADKTMTKPGNV